MLFYTKELNNNEIRFVPTLDSIRIDYPWMTDAQRETYQNIGRKWPDMGLPMKEFAGSAVMVPVYYERRAGDMQPCGMVIGVEPDGYAHS